MVSETFKTLYINRTANVMPCYISSTLLQRATEPGRMSTDFFILELEKNEKLGPSRPS